MPKNQKKNMEELRGFWYKVLEGRREQIEADLDELPAKERLAVIVQISAKLLPTLQAVDLSTEGDGQLRIEARLQALAKGEK